MSARPPVSYTHLDVYKRQYRLDVVPQFLFAVKRHIRLSKGRLLPSAPVSYTHLPVPARAVYGAVSRSWQDGQRPHPPPCGSP